MPRSILLAAVILSITITSCRVGPANSYEDAPRYLRQRGYNEDTIKKVMAFEDVGDDNFRQLISEKSSDVRFLVAQNPNLPRPLFEKLLADSESFVRGGAAVSPNISTSEAVAICKNDDHTVKLYLARNPNVPNDVLIDLRSKYGLELIWFAFNPKCPDELVREMKATNDSDALHELENTRQREEYKKQHKSN